MFKTIYRLRLLVKETGQYYPIHLCALKKKEPTFNDLFKKIQRLIENKDLNLNNYYFATADNNVVIHDDQSLKNALKSWTPDQQRIEIILCRRIVTANKKMVIHLQDTTDHNVPVIKPTVLRWTPATLPPLASDHATTNHHIRRHSSINQDDHCRIDHRKDSGISFDDEPPRQHRKKQRVMSAEHHHHSRKLPDPPSFSSPLPSFLNNITTPSLHPLEITRPSTDPPPSCSSPPTSPFPRPQHHYTLPAISSITCPDAIHHQTLDSQLAPMHHVYQQHQSNTIPIHNTMPTKKPPMNSIFLCDHVNTHHGKVCGQTFRRSYDLSRHQSIHLKNRPFCYCDTCGKKFTRMDALRRHERVQGHHHAKHRSMSLNSALNIPSPQQLRKTSV